jgi:hypothetical protein
MKPILDFIEELYVDYRKISPERIMKFVNFYGYYGADYLKDDKDESEKYFVRCVEWLEIYYPEDHVSHLGMIYFTNKEIAMIMKLSVE